VVASVPEPPREVTYEEAEAAFDDRRYSHAVELFTIYTDRKSENPWGFYMLGLSAWKAGEVETAENAFRRALELDERHVKSMLNLGRVFLDTHRPQEAMAQFDAALTIDPESNVVYRLRGRAFRQLGEKNEAVTAYRKAIQIDNDDVWSMNNLGLMYIEEELFDKALPPLARAVELNGDIPIFLNNLGMALEGIGHFRAAEEAYRSAITADPSYDKAVTNLARVEDVIEDPGLEPVDLDVVATSFIDEIKSWSDTTLGAMKSDSVEAVAIGERTDSENPETEVDGSEDDEEQKD
jgi:Flp pilus assembly protein TadD